MGYQSLGDRSQQMVPCGSIVTQTQEARAVAKALPIADERRQFC